MANRNCYINELSETNPNKMDLEFIQQEILPLLSKRERDIFLASLEEGVTLANLSKTFCFPIVECSRLIKRVNEKINRMYLNGPTALDRQLKGVALTRPQIKRIQQNEKLFEDYGKEFLRQYFLPLLTPKEKKVFNLAILNYRGQDLVDVFAENGFYGNSGSNILSNVIKKLNKYAPKLKERQKNGFLAKEWAPTLKQQQRINENEKYIEENGGRYFLQKYFVPVLAASQKEAFTLGVLEYRGETQTELAKVAGIKIASFNKFLKQSQEKLLLVNPDVLVDYIDGKTRFEVSASVKTAEAFNYNELLRRKEVVEKYGGRAKLTKYFLPTLPELQGQVFYLLYIQQAFSSIRGLAQHLGQNAGIIYAAENIALQKLEQTNFDKLEKIDAMAEGFIKDSFICKASRNTGAPDNEQIVKEFGGEMFMREALIPFLQCELERQICEKHFLQNVSISKLTQLISNEQFGKVSGHEKTLSENGKARRIKQIIKGKILPQLEEMKNCYKEFDLAVKGFYMRKALNILPKEDIDEVTLDNAQEKVEKHEKYEEKFITPTLINNAGGEKVVLREFRSTLKLNQQIILIKTMEQKSPKQIAREMQTSAQKIENEKKIVAQKLEAFAGKKNEK